MESRQSTLRKEQKIPSGHEPSNYVVRRLAVTTADNLASSDNNSKSDIYRADMRKFYLDKTPRFN